MSKLKTPAQGGLTVKKTGWETPLQTPKFDPRLPMTPATRTVRKGEKTRTITISETGSPVAHEETAVSIPVKQRDGVCIYLYPYSIWSH